MRFKLTIETDNAAFDEPYELPEAIYRVARNIEAGADNGKVLDTNGNSVGTWSIR